MPKLWLPKRCSNQLRALLLLGSFGPRNLLAKLRGTIAESHPEGPSINAWIIETVDVIVEQGRGEYLIVRHLDPGGRGLVQHERKGYCAFKKECEEHGNLLGQTVTDTTLDEQDCWNR